MKTLVALFFLVWPLGASAIDYPDLSKYYPLAEGNKWVYDLQIGTREDVVELYDAENNYYVLSFRSEFAKGYHSIRKIGDRLVKVNHQNVLTGELESDVDYKILIAPFKKGLKWVNYDKDNAGYNDKYMFIGLVNTETKAGKFKDTAKFEVIHHSPESRDMVEFQYYAPNVGLVKSEIKLKNKVVTSMELVDYEIKNINTQMGKRGLQ